MTTKKDLVIVILATFCLTFTLFAILPAGSNDSTLGTGEYDPWLDSNDDGKINILECIALANVFGSSGDPTRNVNVTNWPSQQPEPSWKVISMEELNISLTYGNIGTATNIYVGDYSRMFIHMKITNASFISYHPTVIWLNQIIWTTSTYAYMFSSELLSQSTLNLTITSVIECPMYYWFGAPEFKVKAPMFGVTFLCDSDLTSGWITFQVDIYLRNE